MSRPVDVKEVIGKQNCWEFNKCGRQPGGAKAAEYGVCPAAAFTPADGFLGGKNGGRACAYITGTFCNGKIQGTYREKEKNCLACDYYKILRLYYSHNLSLHSFYKWVKLHSNVFEARSVLSIDNVKEVIRKQNCWEFNKCGREPDGDKVAELGVCPAAAFTPADGFLGGKNGGRACVYITGTFCSGKIQGTYREKEKNCRACNYYSILKNYYGDSMSSSSFDRWISLCRIS